MIEIPEAAVLARQLNDSVQGKTILHAVAAHSPHKFAWYQGDPAGYPALLEGCAVSDAYPLGGTLELRAKDVVIALSEGIRLTYHPMGAALPERHQLLLQFTDGCALSAVVQMYGGLLCFKDGEGDNPYYLLAKEKPSPLTDAFDSAYFSALLDFVGAQKLSAKALLATEQRVPGLGNGVLQDILYFAGIHPKRKADTFSSDDIGRLFDALKRTLQDMADQGGRDTESDLFSKPGGYITRCSKFTAGKPCTHCGALIEKAAYMGGSVYFCPACQPL